MNAKSKKILSRVYNVGKSKSAGKIHPDIPKFYKDKKQKIAKSGQNQYERKYKKYKNKAVKMQVLQNVMIQSLHHTRIRNTVSIKIFINNTNSNIDRQKQYGYTM